MRADSGEARIPEREHHAQLAYALSFAALGDTQSAEQIVIQVLNTVSPGAQLSSVLSQTVFRVRSLLSDRGEDPPPVPPQISLPEDPSGPDQPMLSPPQWEALWLSGLGYRTDEAELSAAVRLIESTQSALPVADEDIP